MKDLLLYIARSLVDDPDAVSVTEIQGEQELTLELRVAPDDMGKVIGRQGRIAKEIRTVVRSYAQLFPGADTKPGVSDGEILSVCPPPRRFPPDKMRGRTPPAELRHLMIRQKCAIVRNTANTTREFRRPFIRGRR